MYIVSRNSQGNALFCIAMRVLPCFYGKVKSLLKVTGMLIPENGIRIAALAIQHKVKLATRDRHFDFVDGLEKEEW